MDKKIKKQSNFDKKNILKAIRILRNISDEAKGNSKDLYEISKNPFVYLNFVFNKLPEVDHKKMRKIEVLHPIYSEEYNSEFLIIVSNEFKEANKDVLG